MRPRFRHEVPAASWLAEVGPDAASMLCRLDGTRTVSEILVEAAGQSGASLIPQLLESGFEAGVLDDLDRRPGWDSGPRGAAEFLALTDAGAPADRVRDALRSRLEASVVVVGSGRLGVATAVLLAASGVCGLWISDFDPSSTVHEIDVLPGGHRPADVGTSRLASGMRAIRRARVCAPGRRREPDLVILASGTAVERSAAADRAGRLMRCESPFLWLSAVRGGVEVGPLVIPGRTACLPCSRTLEEGEPATGSPGHEPADAATVALAASRAASASLAAIDGLDDSTLGAMWQVSGRGEVGQRQPWNPQCPCLWGIRI